MGQHYSSIGVTLVIFDYARTIFTVFLQPYSSSKDKAGRLWKTLNQGKFMAFALNHKMLKHQRENEKVENNMENKEETKTQH